MISVLLPTRGRPERLHDSVNSLLFRADDSSQIEILCALDPDDHESARVCAAMTRSTRRAVVSAWTAPQRFGYRQLHRYVNFLAGEATGDWLMVWNDDAVMETEGWDSVVMAQDRQSVLWPQANHAQGGNLFPVFPSWWYHVLGYVSLSPNIDVWLSEVARRLGVEGQIPVRIRHDRPDVTGGQPDATYLEGRELMGPGNDPGYDSQANRVERARAVKVLRETYAIKAR